MEKTSFCRGTARRAPTKKPFIILLCLVVLTISCGESKEAQKAIDELPPLYPVLKLGKWGYMNKSGEIVIKPKFEYTHEFTEGMAAVVIDKKIGFIDRTGKVVIKPQYDWALPFHDDLACD